MRLRWPRSLRRRLLAVYGISTGLSVAAVGALLLRLTEPFNDYTLRSSAQHFAQELAERVVFGPDGVPVGFDKDHIEDWLLTSFAQEVAVGILDGAGRVRYRASAEPAGPSFDGLAFVPGPRQFTLDHGGVAMHGATVPVAQGGRTWYVQVAVSDRLVLQMRDSFARPALLKGMAAAVLVFLVVLLLTTHLVLQRMLQPLRLAALDAQRITPQRLDARLRAHGLPQELAPLVDAFNRALDRLQAGFRTQQDFLANAAHELKTPLALIRAQIELAPAEGRHPMLLQDVDRMARQVQQLLHLAEASEPRNYRMEAVDALGMLAEACGYMDRVAAQAGVQLVPRVDAGAGPWQADRGALFTLLKNLLENAIQHSPRGGQVRVDADGTGFVVADQGPGVPAADLGRLFERFWRSAERRDEGAGLGLSICLEIVRAHGWHIEARPGPVGLEVHVRFAAP